MNFKCVTVHLPSAIYVSGVPLCSQKYNGKYELQKNVD